MVHVLWDASDIWGPLALWGVVGLGVPCKVVRASEVAGGILEQDDAKLLLVPGGFSRHKDAALGDAGREAIRRFVERGGSYFGVCGGASLALTSEHALGICPWCRARYESRYQHYMSGHFYVSLEEGGSTPPLRADWLRQNLPPSPLLPVWWPGRFAPDDSPGVSVLARYDEPGPDFWLADLAVADLSPSVFADWEEKYGFSPSPLFLKGEPCVISGRYGKGEYVLAYTHLETPESADANIWFAHLLETMGGEKPRRFLVPAWNLEELATRWDNHDLIYLWKKLGTVLEAGKAAGQFFSRSSWLMGWRIGLPGAVCNTVRAQMHTILAIAPTPEAAEYWETVHEEFVPAFRAFAKRATSYLLAERLAMTLAKDLPDSLTPEKLLAERAAIFGGSGMAGHAGGLLGKLLPVLDELAFLQLRGYTNRKRC